MKIQEFEFKTYSYMADIGELGDQPIAVNYLVWNKKDGSVHIRIIQTRLFGTYVLPDYLLMRIEDSLIDRISSTQTDEEDL